MTTTPRSHALAALLVSMLAAAGCGISSSSPPDDAATTRDAASAPDASIALLDAGAPDAFSFDATFAHPDAFVADASGPDAFARDASAVDTSVPDADAFMAAESHTYFVARLLGETDDFSTAFGFDLDAMDGGPAGSCTDQADYVSPLTGQAGVDDQMGTLFPTLDGLVGGDGIEGGFRDEIESGRYLLIVTVSDIDRWTDDPSVGVHWYMVRTSSGTPLNSALCASHHDQASCEGEPAVCTWSPMNAACSGLAWDQTFPTMTDLGAATGTIVAGRLATQIDTLPFTLFRMGSTSLSMPIHGVRFGGHITATTLDAELGGHVLVSDLMAAFVDLGFSIDVTSFVSPDVLPNASGSTCSAISIGLRASAIPATRI